MIIETCSTCSGRGGLGRSYSGVTLSYRCCPSCEGRGVIEIPESRQDVLDLESRYDEYYSL